MQTIRQMFPGAGEDQWAAEAWAGFVGDQLPEEFMRISVEKGCETRESAVRAYVAELRADQEVPEDLEEHLLHQIRRYPGWGARCYTCGRELAAGRQVLALPAGEGQLFFCDHDCLDTPASNGALDAFTGIGSHLTAGQWHQAAVAGTLEHSDVPNARAPGGLIRTWYVNEE